MKATAEVIKGEHERRQSATARLIAFLEAQPRVWIAAQDFEQFGRQAWRTRLSEARQYFKAKGGDIENRVTRPGSAVERDAAGQPIRIWLGPLKSEYRYLPHTPIGRPADHYEPQTLFNLSGREDHRR